MKGLMGNPFLGDIPQFQIKPIVTPMHHSNRIKRAKKGKNPPKTQVERGIMKQPPKS